MEVFSLQTRNGGLRKALVPKGAPLGRAWLHNPPTHSRPSGKGCGAGIKADVLTAPGNCLTPTEAVLSLSSWMNIRRDDGKLEGAGGEWGWTMV